MNNLYNDIVKSASFVNNFKDDIRWKKPEEESVESKLARQEKIEFHIDTIANLIHSINNNGFTATGTKVALKDFVTSATLAQYKAPVVETVVKQAIEPKLVISSLFDQIDVPLAAQVNITALGSFEVGEVGEGQEYPTKIFSGFDSEKISFGFKKYGVAIGLTKEAEEMDNWGFLKYWLQQAGYAFARKREEVAYKTLKLLGNVILDNAATTPAGSPLGKTKGRGIDGSYNGTIIPEDLVKAMAAGSLYGVNYDTIIMNPMAYMMFAFSPAMSTIMPAREVLGNWIPKGSAAEGWPNVFGKWSPRASKVGNPGMSLSQGKLGIQLGGKEIAMLGASFYNDPGITGKSIRIVLSPFVSWIPLSSGRGYKTELILVDSSNVGAFLNKEGIIVDKWESKANDVTYIKMSERYGCALYASGLGVGIMKNIIVTEESYAFNLTGNVEFDASKGYNPNADFSSLLS